MEELEYKFILEEECKHFFKENSNSCETSSSLSLRIGRHEDELIKILDFLVDSSFLYVRDKGQDVIYMLRKHDMSTEKSKVNKGVPLKDKVNLIAYLTKREKDVVVCIIRGLSNSEIAKELFISNNTVKNHVSNILRKLDVKNRTQLIKKLYDIFIKTDGNS